MKIFLILLLLTATTATAEDAFVYRGGKIYQHADCQVIRDHTYGNIGRLTMHCTTPPTVVIDPGTPRPATGNNIIFSYYFSDGYVVYGSGENCNRFQSFRRQGMIVHEIECNRNAK